MWLLGGSVCASYLWAGCLFNRPVDTHALKTHDIGLYLSSGDQVKMQYRLRTYLSGAGRGGKGGGTIHVGVGVR